jgi:hypothetical protein
MAVSIIEQQPILIGLNILTPVGQDLIYVVSNQTAVANETRVKFVAEVYIGTTPPNPSVDTPIGTFKTTPNNAGVGMFDLRNVVENYVKADNMAYIQSKYKTTVTSDSVRHPIHLIDQYSRNTNAAKFMIVRFSVEYLVGTTVQIDTNTRASSSVRLIFNGYVKHTDVLNKDYNNFGYDTTKFILADDSSEFLTNAPTTQYANLEDYGTIAFAYAVNLDRIRLMYYDSDNIQIGSTQTVNRTWTNGAFTTYALNSTYTIIYFGCFPGNLQNWSSVFQGITSTIEGGYITVQGIDVSSNPVTKLYTIKVNCPNGKGYEPIRLCWLNQWGAWDYYTFTQKSIKSTSTSGATYNQLAGTWNESLYRPDSYKGGKKAFRVNATEKITMNSDFVTEDEAVIFEELINSPEVYLLKGYVSGVETTSVLNQYVTPVRLLTSSFTKKTIANDKLMQYNFEIEKSKTLRTQAV